MGYFPQLLSCRGMYIGAKGSSKAQEGACRQILHLYLGAFLPGRRPRPQCGSAACTRPPWEL